uniref:Energy transducer TonB n=1 Tax=Roseihalotalea indica TaxID=2867963 RepID=A0AA49GNQ6_9BACT|nr:energy transducer TonB [Tunicatimonas sp. TK19036]
MNLDHHSAPSWNDLLFEHRNRNYGAYQIRKHYAEQVLKAFALAVGVLVILIMFPTMLGWLHAEEEMKTLPARTIHYTELAPPPPIEQVPPPQTEAPPPVKKVVKYVPPKVTTQELPEEEPLPTIEEIKQVETGLEDIAGTGEVMMDIPVEGSGEVPAPEEAIYQFVEQMPEFDGGMEAMAKFLQKNLRYPASARRMGIEGTVYVKFVIGTNGTIEAVEVMKGIFRDCDQEAVRVISQMPPWKPGKQNKQEVKVSMMLPIKFKLA